MLKKQVIAALCFEITCNLPFCSSPYLEGIHILQVISVDPVIIAPSWTVKAVIGAKCDFKLMTFLS